VRAASSANPAVRLSQVRGAREFIGAPGWALWPWTSLRDAKGRVGPLAPAPDHLGMLGTYSPSPGLRRPRATDPVAEAGVFAATACARSLVVSYALPAVRPGHNVAPNRPVPTVRGRRTEHAAARLRSV